MDASKETESTPRTHQTTTERKAERELVATRFFDAPAQTVFQAWTTPELMTQWWTPKSSGASLLACEMDVRVGGGYRLVFGHGDSPPMEFFGKYTDVVPGSRLVWTNEEGEGALSVTTVTFAERDGRTQVVIHEQHPSKEAADGALAMGMDAAMRESHAQLDDVLVMLGRSGATEVRD